MTLLPIALFAAAACLPVEGEHILARDLARANPVFAAIPSETSVGFTPNPGSTRIFQPLELRALAARHHIEAGNSIHQPICVTYAVSPPDPERLLEALRRSLGDTAQQIEIIDYSKVDMPKGTLVFPAARVNDRATIFHGTIRYAGSRSMSIWVRARVASSIKVLVAAVPLTSGTPVEPDQVALAPATSASTAGFLTSVNQLNGRAMIRNVPVGTPLKESMLLAPMLVTAGQSVKVEARSGAAVVTFTARAESAGRAGTSILVLNETSKRRFQARVTGPGTVSAILQP